MTTNRSQKTRRGLTLVETLVVLGIIAVAVIGILSYGNTASNTQRSNDARTQINALIIGIQQLYAGIGGYATLGSGQTAAENVINGGFAPQPIINATRNGLINPWRGAYNIAGTTSNFTIEVTGVPREGCQALLGARMPNGNSIVSISLGGNTLSVISTPAQIQTAVSSCAAADNTLTVIAR